MKNIELVRNYIKKFPTTPSLTLAKKIYAENNDIFLNIESARTTIRRARGVMGKYSRKSVINKELYINPRELDKNPFRIPKSDSEKAKVLTLPKELNNILVISDVHIPYHDIPALTTTFKYGKEKGINCIFINGDLLDFFHISRFASTVRRKSMQQEIDMAKEFLTALNTTFPNVPIYFLKGNHDIRLETYLSVKAPELLDCEALSLAELLEADQHNLIVLNDNILVKMGKLNVTHGHLLIRGVFAPVNSARGVFLKAKASTLIGHVHKISTHSETTITGKVITCYSTGSLCELNPLYSPFGNNYTHGFAHVTVEPSGNYAVKNIQIINGTIIN